MQINEILKNISKYAKTPISIIFWLLLIFAFESPRCGCMTVLSALIHEAGHFLYTLLYLKSPSPPRGALSGFRIKKKGVMSYGEEMMLYLSGPIANLAFSLALLPFFSVFEQFAKEFFIINMFTMLSNLLPVEGYDGYGAILAIAQRFGAECRVREALCSVSFLITALMMLISLYLMYYLNGGYWIYAVFSISAFSFIKKSLNSQKRRFNEI